MIFYNFFFLYLWMQLVKTNTKTWRPALCKPLCVEGLCQLTSGPQFVSSPAGTHRTLTCWTLGMYLSTEKNQGLNYFLIRFSAFIIPFLKSYQGPHDLVMEQSSMKGPFSSSFQQAPFLPSTVQFGAQGVLWGVVTHLQRGRTNTVTCRVMQLHAGIQEFWFLDTILTALHSLSTEKHSCWHNLDHVTQINLLDLSCYWPYDLNQRNCSGL